MTERYQSLWQRTKDSFDQYDLLSIEERAEHSGLAMDFFLRASVSEPSSVTCQGALIATLCQKEGITDPYVYGICLQEDTEKVDMLVEKAIKAHQIRVKKQPNVNAEIMRSIIGKDFETAKRFITFSPEDLAYIRNDLKHDQSVRSYGEAHFLEVAFKVPTTGRVSRIPREISIEIFK